MNCTIGPADMASLEVLNTQTDSVSFQMDDYSLLAEVQTGNTSNADNFNFTNMQSALTGASSNDSSVEVQSQINELIEENQQLRDKNMKMEESFKEANEKISSLENEVVELRKKVTDSTKNQTQQCKKCETFEWGLTNMLGVDYVEENQHLLLEWSNFRENLAENLKYICRHLEEISKAKKTWEEKILFDAYALMLKFKIAYLETNTAPGNCLSLRTDEETGFEVVYERMCKDAQTRIQLLSNQIEEKDRELNLLKCMNEELIKKMNVYELKIQECEAQPKSQTELVSSKLETESSLLQEYKERCKILEGQIEEYQARLNSGERSDDTFVKELQEEIQNLKIILKEQQEANKKDKDQLLEIMSKCEKFQVDYDRVTKLLEIQSKDEKEKDKELTLREMNSKKYMEEADHLTAQLIEVREQLEERNEEIKELQNQLAQATKKESDSSGSHSRESRQRHQNAGVSELILCPICNKGFTMERAAQNHIERCLEENGQ